MPRIFRRTDRIPVKIDDITVVISPLTLDQKTEVQDLIGRGKMTGDFKLATKGVVTAIRYALREIKGLETADGKPYQLEFENDMVSENSINDLFNLEMYQKLSVVCSNLVGSFPTEFVDNQGKRLEGVEILPVNSTEPTSPN